MSKRMISYISLPFVSTKGIEYIRVNLSDNTLTTSTNDLLVDIQEVVDDLHHFTSSDDGSIEAEINTIGEQTMHLDAYLDQIRRSIVALKTQKEKDCCCEACLDGE